MKKIYYHLPGAFEHFDFYMMFLTLYKNERNKFYEWAEIGSIYGSPRDVIWNGGRTSIAGQGVEDRAMIFKELEVPVGLTFTNCLLKPEHINDVHGNAVLKKFNWEGNKVIVNSLDLMQHIKKNYSSYGFISSTTKCIKDKQKVNEEINNPLYDVVVLDYNFNKDLDFLSTIDKPEKCELLINPVCYPNCPRRKLHYQLISKASLYEPYDENFRCDAECRMFYESQKSSLFIGIKEIQETYAPMGFKHFKIEGRTTSIDDLLEILLYYMVKPEYQLEVRERMYAKKI